MAPLKEPDQRRKQTKGNKTVISPPKPASSWLGPKTSLQGPAHMRAASWAYGQSKRPTPIPGVCRFTAGRPVPCTKIPISSTSYYFLNQLYARAAQSSCRKPRPELRSNALPAQNRQLSSVQAYGLAKVRTHGSIYGEPKVLLLDWPLSERQKGLIERDKRLRHQRQF